MYFFTTSVTLRKVALFTASLSITYRLGYLYETPKQINI